MSRPRILLFQPYMDGAGGGQSVAVYVAQALVPDHDVTLLTMRLPDLDDANRRFGTSLRRSDFAGFVVLSGAARLINGMPLARLAHLERALLLRRGRAIARNYDLVVSAANEVDLGRHAVQYVHFPAGYYPRPDTDRRWYHLPGALPLYYALSSRIATMSPAEVASNRTLVNSHWTGGKFIEIYGGEVTVLHPPITRGGPGLPWEQRRNGFAVLGRIAPEKRILEVIEILERLRSRGFGLTLDVIGTEDHRPYTRRVRAAAESRPWVRMLLDRSRDEVHAAIGSVKYGIHGMVDEHFGMAPAEMARAGCIVFVPDDGGQVEIVRDPELRYGSSEEAVEKIAAVLTDEERRRTARERLRRETEGLTVEAFTSRFREIVAEELRRPR